MLLFKHRWFKKRLNCVGKIAVLLIWIYLQWKVIKVAWPNETMINSWAEFNKCFHYLTLPVSFGWVFGGLVLLIRKISESKIVTKSNQTCISLSVLLSILRIFKSSQIHENKSLTLLGVFTSNGTAKYYNLLYTTIDSKKFTLCNINKTIWSSHLNNPNKSKVDGNQAKPHMMSLV